MSFASNITCTYGDFGKNWLKSIPNTIRTISQKYQLSKLTPLENLSYHYVLQGFKEQLPIILKLGPNPNVLKHEYAALKAFSGFGVVKVLAEDEGMLLLEQVIPGRSLKTLFPNNDYEATIIACDLIRSLHKAPIPTTSNFENIANSLKAFDNIYGIPDKYLTKARKFCDYLLATCDKQVLLHGDLHHDNILQHNNDWIAIDPKGLVGDPVYETVTFIYNPIPELISTNNHMDIIKNRIAVFAKSLNFPIERIISWFFVKTVLSWIWCIEDKLDTSYFEKLTITFDELYHL